jgi:hypothetical protein
MSQIKRGQIEPIRQKDCNIVVIKNNRNQIWMLTQHNRNADK